jgi:selenocysteine lyase/cysteine desulfurase
LLVGSVLGNPHSNNPTSAFTTEKVEAVRQRILDYFHAGDDYDLIFTPNASGALKVLGESYPWKPKSTLLLARDNHNSVMGLREFAQRAEVSVHYWELTPELRLQPTLSDLLTLAQARGDYSPVLAMPAQSNFSGVIHPLEYVRQAKAMGATVWLDAAAFVPTHSLDLSAVPADAVCISLYKILGFPTGIGALIIRKELLAKLQKPWFAGGTVRGVSLESHVLEPAGHERFEDGTINYACIPALEYVLDYIQSVGGVEVIGSHVHDMTALALDRLSDIPGVRIYGPADMVSRGGTIAFNIMGASGTPVSYSRIEQLAAERSISLRAGCFCNPGAGSKAFGLVPETMSYLLRALETKTKAEADVPGAVRISFGIATNEADVDATVLFIKDVARVVAA